MNTKSSLKKSKKMKKISLNYLNTIRKNYVEFYEGDIPIIITSSHGGELSPHEIDDRDEGVFESDDFTKELSEAIIAEFYLQIKKIPYAVIAEISRTKVDLNRDEDEAYESDKAGVIYDSFHSLIKRSRVEIEHRFKKGLYLDIHGQSHSHGAIEFGYLLFNDTLQLHGENLEQFKGKSSINTLSQFSDESFIEQLKGKNSLGSLMQNRGYDSIPSSEIPFAKDNDYFEGAYNTISYGSLDGGNISGIQVEFPYKNVRDTEENRERCAKEFVSSVIGFMKVHFGVDLRSVENS